ncbi:MAG: YidB family protein [Vicinamibacterales bacterium]
MGLLDGMMGGALGSMLGQGGAGALGSLLSSAGGGSSQQGAGLVAAALSMVQQQGGVGAVLEKLRAGGLAAEVDSWVGTGANLPVSADALQKALGGANLAPLASQLGMQPGEVSASLAKVLPELVNMVTPQGALPDGADDVLAQGLSMLRGLGR